MDDLDRLAFRLVRTIRQDFPQLRAQGFTLSDLEERLLPYRDARREMANGGADAWERTLLRLVAGEREYVLTDDDLQTACRQALASPSPTMALVRSWAMTSLTLGAAVDSVGSERVTAAVDAVKPRRTPHASSSKTTATTLPAGSKRAEPAVVSVLPPSTSQAKKCDGSTCRFCSGRLPDGRAVTFCPRCGVDQTKRQCPACSTELETAWRFCVTCGRSADLPDIPLRITRAAS